MISINNVQPLSPEIVFDLLKKELSDYINAALGSNLTIEFAHVSDVINIIFPEIIEGNTFTVIVSEAEITIQPAEEKGDYNTDLLEQHLVEFITMKAS